MVDLGYFGSVSAAHVLAVLLLVALGDLYVCVYADVWEARFLLRPIVRDTQ